MTMGKINVLRVATLLALSFTGSSAFTTPLMATRAVVKKAPAKAKPAAKAVAKKAPSKKAAPKIVAPKKAAPKIAAPKIFAQKKAAPKKAAPTKPAPKKAAPKKAAPKKVALKKVAPKKVAPKKVAPQKVARVAAKGAIGQKAKNNKNFIYSSQGYVSISSQAQNFRLPSISGGGNRKPQVALGVWDFSDPKLQIKRDPKFYAEAAKTRLIKQQEFVYDDGLTVIERKQKGIQGSFLTGSAKSQIDTTAIADVQGVDYFGLSGDRFQLLFITLFGLFTLVGCLSGNLKL